MTDIAFDKQKIQKIMLKMQNKVGLNLVKPAVVFKKPFESIPLAMARIKKI